MACNPTRRYGRTKRGSLRDGFLQVCLFTVSGRASVNPRCESDVDNPADKNGNMVSTLVTVSLFGNTQYKLTTGEA